MEGKNNHFHGYGMRSFLLALQFLTILPVKVRGEVSEADMARSAVAFPVVGLLQGVILVAAALLLGRVFQPGMAVALLLLVLVLSNGGFHLDGLADTFDAFAARGDRWRKLDAMKDSSTGAIGVTAIVFALALKYLALRDIFSIENVMFYGTLVLMPVLSKWAMLLCMLTGRPARKDGLGRTFVENIRGGAVAAATLVVLVLSSLPALLWDTRRNLVFPVSLILILILGLILVHVYKRQFGGLTGDTLGAAGEITEITFLLAVGVWQRFYI